MNQDVAVNSPVTKDNPRDYLMDNLRAIFIILVVWGHILTSMKDQYDNLRSLYIFIFFFHMPAMAFVSGYFSKNLEKIRSNAFVTVFLPYLFLNTIEYAFKVLILHEDLSYQVLNPFWGLWYLLALFLWKFFLKDIVKIRFILPLSFVIAVLSGFSGEFSDDLALGRTLCFLPFFLLGYYCTQEHITRIRKLPKLLGIVIIAAVAVLSTYAAYTRLFKLETLYLRGPYPEEAQLESMLYRILVYVVACAMIFAVTSLFTGKKTILSYIGTSTMTVYIFHLFTIPLLEKLRLFENQPYVYLIYSILMTALITFVYTLPVVKKAYDTIMDKLTGLIYSK